MAGSKITTLPMQSSLERRGQISESLNLGMRTAETSCFLGRQNLIKHVHGPNLLNCLFIVRSF